MVAPFSRATTQQCVFNGFPKGEPRQAIRGVAPSYARITMRAFLVGATEPKKRTLKRVQLRIQVQDLSVVERLC